MQRGFIPEGNKYDSIYSEGFKFRAAPWDLIMHVYYLITSLYTFSFKLEYTQLFVLINFFAGVLSVSLAVACIGVDNMNLVYTIIW